MAKALALGGSVAIVLLGEAIFRRTLSMGGERPRALAALLALATIPVGTSVSAAAQLALMLGLLVVMLAHGERNPSPGRHLARAKRCASDRCGRSR